jgi:hypothetical protein
LRRNRAEPLSNLDAKPREKTGFELREWVKRWENVLHGQVAALIFMGDALEWGARGCALTSSFF